MAMIYCVRHGNTFLPGEEPRRVGGRTDLPLVPSGETQAINLGRYFSNLGISFSSVFSSPLSRTRRTAELIISTTRQNLKPEFLEFLREIDYGPDENKLESDVRLRLGEESIDLWESDGIVPQGWLLEPETLTNNWRLFFKQQAHLKECNVLVVTSNGIARFALNACDRIDATISSRKIRTGAFGCIEVTQGQVILRQWDRRPDE